MFYKIRSGTFNRPDLVRQDWLTELTNLQDNLPAFDHKIALKIIEENLARHLMNYLMSSLIAYCSASLGQVYKAKKKIILMLL